MTASEKRNDILDWLVAIGAPGMDEGRYNRDRMAGFLEEYARLKNETLLRELKLVQRTEAERKAAWRKKHEREWARKKQKRLCQK